MIGNQTQLSLAAVIFCSGSAVTSMQLINCIDTPAIKGMGYELQSIKNDGRLSKCSFIVNKKFGSCELWPVLKTIVHNMCAMPFVKEQLTIYMHGCVCLTSSFNRLPRLLHTVVLVLWGFFVFCLRDFSSCAFLRTGKNGVQTRSRKKKIKQEKQAQFRAGSEPMVYFSCWFKGPMSNINRGSAGIQNRKYTNIFLVW